MERGWPRAQPATGTFSPIDPQNSHIASITDGCRLPTITSGESRQIQTLQLCYPLVVEDNNMKWCQRTTVCRLMVELSRENAFFFNCKRGKRQIMYQIINLVFFCDLDLIQFFVHVMLQGIILKNVFFKVMVILFLDFCSYKVARNNAKKCPTLTLQRLLLESTNHGIFLVLLITMTLNAYVGHCFTAVVSLVVHPPSVIIVKSGVA